MADKKVQRDRLNAYVMPDTTKIINEIKQEKMEEMGIKLTIGQCVDILAKAYMSDKGE